MLYEGRNSVAEKLAFFSKIIILLTSTYIITISIMPEVMEKTGGNVDAMNYFEKKEHWEENIKGTNSPYANDFKGWLSNNNSHDDIISRVDDLLYN